MISANRLKGVSIVCFGLADWDTENWTNQHHLMSRLGCQNTVLFVESLGLRRPAFTGRDLRRIAKRLRGGLRPLRESDGVHIVSPLVIPFHQNRVVAALNGVLMRRFVRRAVRQVGAGTRPILWAYAPQAYQVIETLDPSAIIYHCVDDLATYDRVDATQYRAAEERLASRADLVIASSQPLARRLEALNPNVQLMPNVADTSLFAHALDRGPIDGAIATLPRPRVVFVGAVSAIKVDFALIVGLARLRPAWTFVLVGPVGLGDPSTDISELASEPNVHFVGHRAMRDLPAVLRGCDAGLIPYRLTPHTASVFPMKVYEYLSAGLPVVSTPLPSLEGVEGVVMAPDAPGFAASLEGLIAADSEPVRVERSRRAAGHSWEARIDEIERALAEVA